MAQHIAFDYDGALTLARHLWAAAESIELLAHRRSFDAETSETWFLGPNANDFRILGLDEVRLADDAVAQLRRDAQTWAEAWAEAINEQNRMNYEASRALWTNLGSPLTEQSPVGPSADRVEPPNAVAPPVGPHFAETGSLLWY